MVLPVEWSRGFWAIYMMHVRFAAIAGLGRDATLVGGWPAPELTADSLGLPCCDILSTCESSRSGVQEKFDAPGWSPQHGLPRQADDGPPSKKTKVVLEVLVQPGARCSGRALATPKAARAAMLWMTWSSEIIASDACESGIAICVGSFPLDVVEWLAAGQSDGGVVVSSRASTDLGRCFTRCFSRPSNCSATRLQDVVQPREGFLELDPEAMGLLGGFESSRTMPVGRMRIKEDITIKGGPCNHTTI